jgi:nucleotide-binding universal stress UspA family protein
MFKRILVPLDGSDTAENVLSVAIEEARLHSANVILLRVIAPLRQSLMASPGSINIAFEEIDCMAEDYLEGVAEKFQNEGIEVETLIEHGLPAKQVLETANENECDLIIIGTHGETGAFEWRFGGVANKIIKAKSPIPVLVITTN